VLSLPLVRILALMLALTLPLMALAVQLQRMMAWGRLADGGMADGGVGLKRRWNT
jgi:hypothetical protein